MNVGPRDLPLFPRGDHAQDAIERSLGELEADVLAGLDTGDGDDFGGEG